MLIKTKQLVIRPLQPGDETPFTDMAADGSLTDIGFSKDCGGWMKRWIAEARALTDADDPTSDYLAYAVTLKDSGAVIGSVGCSYYHDLQLVGITWFIGAQHRNNGYASEAAKAYIKYFFSHYGISTLIATVKEANISSWKAAEKAGFTFIGQKQYQDINDVEEELYRFYEIRI